MFKKLFLVSAALFFLAVLPALSQAQTSGNNAPLGSKQNPIKPTSVTPSNHSTASAKGKRGSKTNPIAGNVHPRGTGAN